MTSVAEQVIRISKLEYLEGMSRNELAYWLIHSFSPERYRNIHDVVEPACRMMYRHGDEELITEFIHRLWGMHGLEPDYIPNSDKTGKVVNFRKNEYA